ncbi:MAG: helix-turn-helix domain-containing protein [Oscillospiraceae bacterium]|nr:helix-turn-helix domain-containing protein [Oscillospiraceae bacterium]
MTLGEKIKNARLERHMTQKDVVGDYITRNMLSKIENGSATPSVKTLEYLASALGLPAGYFMSESGGDEFTPGGMSSARAHFREGEYEGCVQVLSSMDLEGGYRDEALLLLARSKISLSKQAMAAGRNEEAIRLAKEALAHNDDTIYRSAAFRTEALLLVARCTMELGGDFDKAMDDYQAAYQDQGLGEFYRLTMAEYYIDQGDLEKARSEMDSIARLSEATKPAYLMLQGRMELEDNQYTQAAKQLEKAEQLARGTGSSYFMSSLYAMLEQCYREMEDFKKAYHYASMQLKIKE